MTLALTNSARLSLPPGAAELLLRSHLFASQSSAQRCRPPNQREFYRHVGYYCVHHQTTRPTPPPPRPSPPPPPPPPPPPLPPPPPPPPRPPHHHPHQLHHHRCRRRAATVRTTTTESIATTWKRTREHVEKSARAGQHWSPIDSNREGTHSLQDPATITPR